MKKIFLLLAAACVTLSAAADEGMWMLPYLQKMNSKDMKARGCKLSAEEIYSMNNSSLKDAIVIFGGGCTGEIVSPDGLLFTNHHCGYGSIQSLSSVEHDYLKNGFWAMSRAEELPAPGLKVRFIRRIVDVTPDVLGAVPDIAGGGEREELVAGQVKAVSERLAGENPGMDVEIKSFFGGNQYFAFVIEVFRDVRLVGAPPTSIGKFGGDTDNWMWPRHTGDFSVFRVYAGPDNRPADYSPENRPYKAEKFLKISLGGYDEGDFAMIMGFPGSTQRYMTSYEIDRMLEVENPQRIFIRGERQAILKEDMAASDKVRIQYGERIILNDLDWTVNNGERWALSGQNGAGKSTLLSLVCADNPQSYACDIALFGNPRGSGESIWDIKKHIGYVSPELHRSYQRDMPAIRIVASGLTDSVGLYVKPKEEDMDQCRFWMKVFGLEGLEDRGFLKLSSGEQRLVLLARAFVKDPELLILDEPLHGLDNRNHRLVKDIIEAFCKRKNKTMIMVTHYKEELPACIDHSIFLKRHTK